jgi:hypothetical protein
MDSPQKHFLPSPVLGALELRRVARTGGDDELVVPGTWSFSSVIADEQPSLLVVTPDVIFRQPKDGSQRTALVVDTGHIGQVTADACNVYWSSSDPPRVRGRSR